MSQDNTPDDNINNWDSVNTPDDNINNWDPFNPLTPTRWGLQDLKELDSWDEVGTNQMRANLTTIRFARLQEFKAQLEEIRSLPEAA